MLYYLCIMSSNNFSPQVLYQYLVSRVQKEIIFYTQRVSLYFNQRSKSMKNFLFVLLICFISSIKAQVLGIDFGTEFWKAALISPGKNLVIVENSRSERKTLNSIAFHEGVRFFQDDSKSKRLKKPEISYFYLNRLIRSLDTKQPIQGYKFVEDTYVFEDDDKSMTLEQVVGMILKNIKQLASHQAGTDIRDVVISVPSNWGFHAKLCLVNAANLADFSVLGLINENSAAAIHFAISRNDTEPLNIIIFNYGSHNLQVSMIKAFGYFDESKNKTIQSIQMLGHVTKQNVGGLKVDEKIAEYLAEQFKKKHKVDPRKNKKSYTKLLIKSADVKQTLSANKEAQVYIEGLIDGIDLNLHINRQVIQSSQHFAQIANSLEQLISTSGLTKSDIHSVEIIGGASRIPKITTLVKQYFSAHQKVQVGSHINGDQSVAFGAALRAANLSLTFRVKQLHFYDPMNLDTKVVVSSPDKGVIVEETLFHLSDHHGTKKSLSLNHNDEDIKITVYVGDEIVKQFAAKGVYDWKKKHQNQNITGTPNLIIQFMMSSIHIADIKDIYVNVTINTTSVRQKVQYVEEEVEIEVPVEQRKEKKEGQNKEQQKQQGDQKKQQQESKDAKTEEPALNQTDKIKKKINKTKTVKKLVEEHEVRPKKHIPSYEQTFSKYKRYSKEQAEEKRKLLHQYEAHEKALKQKAKIRNDFESALYHLKDNFEEKYLKTFGKQFELKKLIETVTSQLEWLDENAWTASKQLFQQHFKTLTDAYHPIYNRTMQYRERQKTYNESMNYLGMVYQRTNDLITSHFWIKEKVESHLKKINETAEWISNKIKEQFERPLNQNPILFNHQMIQKAQELRNQYYIMKMAPRPKIDDILKQFGQFKKKNQQEQEKKEQKEGQKKQEANQQTEQEGSSSQDTEQQNNEQKQNQDL